MWEVMRNSYYYRRLRLENVELIYYGVRKKEVCFCLVWEFNFDNVIFCFFIIRVVIGDVIICFWDKE